jgi:4-hydroxy-3-methylbut-2-enyl diphosphate reductase
VAIIEIDKGSGFCFGVTTAIRKAEEELNETGHLYCLGDIVHNTAEVDRLASRGLETITHEQLKQLHDVKVLLRAHGEPPRTYELAREKGFEVVDFTCPVVLNIQKSIREAWQRGRPDGQIVIFGKIGHAEVLGLVGQVDGKALVVENLQQLQDALKSGAIDVSRRIDIFSQTTKSPVEYEEICSFLAGKMASGDILTVHNTICRQVASRHRELVDFARRHDVIVFVAGRESSNGKVLSELCKGENPRTYNIGSASELNPSWFCPDDSVGVCGATSTPKWLLEEVASQIKNLH